MIERDSAESLSFSYLSQRKTPELIEVRAQFSYSSVIVFGIIFQEKEATKQNDGENHGAEDAVLKISAENRSHQSRHGRTGGAPEVVPPNLTLSVASENVPGQKMPTEKPQRMQPMSAMTGSGERPMIR